MHLKRKEISFNQAKWAKTKIMIGSHNINFRRWSDNTFFVAAFETKINYYEVNKTESSDEWKDRLIKGRKMCLLNQDLDSDSDSND